MAIKKQPKKKFILLVEDDQLLANLISVKLTNAGFDVQIITQGGGVTEYIKKKKPDALLLDIMLPVKDGLTILAELQEAGIVPDLPVMIISNSGQPVDIDRAKKMGIRDYLVKVNFDPQEVLEKVLQLLEENGQDMSATSLKGATKATILIVEDDAMYIEVLQMKFNQQNYKLLWAPNVEQAKKLLAENTIDLILLDIILPGVNGLSFLQELKANETFSRIPVIITSNLGQQEEIDRGLRLGAVDYIVKAHILPKEIVEKVKNILKK